MAVFTVTCVSIIIPTKGDRPAYLKRAIESTRCSDDTLTIEVVVALNGERESNFSFPSETLDTTDIRNLTIKVVNAGTANVSHARNIGLSVASGLLIRFLDDDDFLIPEIAQKQYLEMLSTECDLSTYGGRIEDESGVSHQTIQPTSTSDYASAVLGPQCPALTFASTYRRELIAGIQWNEEYRHTEDEDWMRRILSVKDPIWISREEVVGVWFQHAKPRLSKSIPVAPYYMNRAASIIQTIKILKLSGRLNSARSTAAANGLWSSIHGGFYFSPLRWSRIAKYAIQLDKNSCPRDPLFTTLHPYLRPIFIEWLVLPKRWFNHLMRIVKGRLFGWNNIRKI